MLSDKNRNKKTILNKLIWVCLCSMIVFSLSLTVFNPLLGFLTPVYADWEVPKGLKSEINVAQDAENLKDVNKTIIIERRISEDRKSVDWRIVWNPAHEKWRTPGYFMLMLPDSTFVDYGTNPDKTSNYLDFELHRRKLERRDGKDWSKAQDWGNFKLNDFNTSSESRRLFINGQPSLYGGDFASKVEENLLGPEALNEGANGPMRKMIQSGYPLFLLCDYLSGSKSVEYTFTTKVADGTNPNTNEPVKPEDIFVVGAWRQFAKPHHYTRAVIAGPVDLDNDGVVDADQPEEKPEWKDKSDINRYLIPLINGGTLEHVKLFDLKSKYEINAIKFKGLDGNFYSIPDINADNDEFFNGTVNYKTPGVFTYTVAASTNGKMYDISSGTQADAKPDQARIYIIETKVKPIVKTNPGDTVTEEEILENVDLRTVNQDKEIDKATIKGQLLRSFKVNPKLTKDENGKILSDEDGRPLEKLPEFGNIRAAVEIETIAGVNKPVAHTVYVPVSLPAGPEKAQHPVKEPRKVKVNNGAITLSKEQKDEVLKNATDANGSAKPYTTVNDVADDGTVTLRYSDNSTNTLKPNLTLIHKPKLTPVANINDLMPIEKLSVSKAIRDANPDVNHMHMLSDFVTNTGVATAKYFDDEGEVTDDFNVTFDQNETVVQIPEFKKTPVKNKENLDDDEKGKVKGEVKKKLEKAIPGLTINDGNILVGQDGTTTVTIPDTDPVLIPGEIVISKDDTVIEIPKPKKTPVNDKGKLTDGEKDKVKERVKEKLKEEIPGLTINDGDIKVDADGTTTVTIPDTDPVLIPGEIVISKDDTVIEIPKPDKTPVIDKKKLTEDEKDKVKEKVKTKLKEEIPGLTINDGDIKVDADGTTTVTIPDTNPDIKGPIVISGKDTVIEIPKPDKTPVKDKTNLTDDEKTKVKEKVKEKLEKEIPGLTINDGDIEVGPDGTATVTIPGKDPIVIPGGNTVIEIPKPDKTPVEDKRNLKDPEKDKVKKKIENKLKDDNPDLTINDGEIVVGLDGTATITIPGVEPFTISGDKTVIQVADPKITLVNDRNALTDDEKGKVKAKVKEKLQDDNKGTDDKPGLVVQDDEIVVGPDGTATITIPGVEPFTISGDKTVIQVSDPDKTLVADKTNLTNSEKEKVKAKVKKKLEEVNIGKGDKPILTIDESKIVVENDGKTTVTIPNADPILFKGEQTVVQINKPKHMVPVGAGEKLTDDQKEAILKEIIEVNPDLKDLLTKENVDSDGKVTIYDPVSGDKIVEIPETDTVIRVNDPVKTLVKKIGELTDEEKEKVAKRVNDANKKAPQIDKTKVDENGNVTITFPGGYDYPIPSEKTVYEKEESTPTVIFHQVTFEFRDKDNLPPEVNALLPDPIQVQDEMAPKMPAIPAVGQKVETPDGKTFVFKRWDNIPGAITKPLTLYGVWEDVTDHGKKEPEVIKHEVTFIFENSDSLPQEVTDLLPGKIEVVHGEKPVLPTLAKERVEVNGKVYIFKEWINVPDKITAPGEIKGRWAVEGEEDPADKPAVMHTVTFDFKNYKEIDAIKAQLPPAITVADGDNFELPEIESPVTLGDGTEYTFNGWDNVPAKVQSDITIYGKWTKVGKDAGGEVVDPKPDTGGGDGGTPEPVIKNLVTFTFDNFETLPKQIQDLLPDPVEVVFNQPVPLPEKVKKGDIVEVDGKIYRFKRWNNVPVAITAPVTISGTWEDITLTINKPEITKVVDDTKLTDEEKEKVIEKIIEKNPDLVDKVIEVDDDGHTVIKDPDGTKRGELDKKDTVEKIIPDNTTYEPTVDGDVHKDAGDKATEKEVSDKVKIPEGSGGKITSVIIPDDTSAGEKEAIVTVTYPDGTTDVVKVKIIYTDPKPTPSKPTKPEVKKEVVVNHGGYVEPKNGTVPRTGDGMGSMVVTFIASVTAAVVAVCKSRK